MRYILHSINVFCAIFLSLGDVTLGAETVRERNSKIIERPKCPPVWPLRYAMTMRYEITARGKTKKATVTCLIPQSLDRRQKVERIDYSIKPTKVFSANGSRYAQFVFDYPKGKIDIEVKAIVETYRYDLTIAECEDKAGELLTDSQLRKYLVSERFIESDDEKIELAAMLTGRDGELERIQSVFDFVIEYLKYAGYTRKAQGAEETFEIGKGDCTDYTDLLVAMCRAKEIPARHVTGLIAFATDTVKHSWAEVYTKQFGWIPLDALQADLNKRGYGFDRLRNRHIYLSDIRNDPTMAGKYTFWFYRYKGDPIKVTDTYEVEKINSAKRGN